MKNRAKCKKCQSIIESFHTDDYVECDCGLIAVDGGEAMRCYAIEWTDFVRVDDEGNEVIPKIKPKIDEQKIPSDTTLAANIPTKKDVLEMLEEMIKSYEKLPLNAMHAPATNADLCSILILMKALYSAES